jgi:hypothetical protein
MRLKPIRLIVLFIGGFACGKSQVTLRVRSIALAAILMILAQGALRPTLPHAAIEELAERVWARWAHLSSSASR